MTCPNCGSQNVNVQAVAHITQKRHGVLWWLLIGWWWVFLKWLFFFLPALIIKLIKGPKYKSVTTVEAVCQNCGHHWRIKKPIRRAQTISKEPRFETLVPNVQAALSHMFDEEVGVSENEKDWAITRDGLKYTLISNIKIQGISRHTKVEIDFPDENYDTFFVRRLEIDGQNIEI